MSDEQIQPASTDLNIAKENGPTGIRGRRSGLMRAALYTPVVVILSGLAALATFPELARYAGPLVGESSDGNYSCPIAALASRMGCGSGSCSSKSSSDATVNALLASESASDAPAGCCAKSALARFNCCAGSDACPASTTESSETTETAPSTEEAPADAFATANGVDLDAPSN